MSRLYSISQSSVLQMRFIIRQATGVPTVFANGEHSTLVCLHHKLDQAALESRRTHCTTPKTAIPEAKTYVGGDCSTQVERTT